MRTPAPPAGGNRGTAWWRRRSRKGKAGTIAAALVGAFVVIGVLAPAPEDTAGEIAKVSASAVPPAQAAPETTTNAEPEGPAPPPPPSPPAVAEVVDGDTIRLDDGTRVRLVQIDAPELRSGECYAQKASRELRRLLPPGTVVRLERDRRLDGVDQYGRALRYVHEGSTNVNLALVRRGAASVWFYRGERGRYAERLIAAAETAEARGLGLWGACLATLDPFRALDTSPPPPPPPPPAPPPPAVAAPPPSNCHPSYEGACLDPYASDYDCAGGSGNGPKYTGPVRVVGPDEYGLDADGDGWGCEAS